MTLLCLLAVLWGQNYLALISQELQTSYRGTQISEKRFAFRGHFNRKIWSHLDFWALLGRNKGYVPRTNSKLPLIGMDNWATGRDTTASGVAKTPSLHEKSTDSYLATSLKILFSIYMFIFQKKIVVNALHIHRKKRTIFSNGIKHATVVSEVSCSKNAN